MSPEELEQYYLALREMFMTVGWQTFIEDIEAAASICTLEACNSAEEFWKAKGRMEVYNRVMNYEDFIKADEAIKESEGAVH